MLVFPCSSRINVYDRTISRRDCFLLDWSYSIQPCWATDSSVSGWCSSLVILWSSFLVHNRWPPMYLVALLTHSYSVSIIYQCTLGACADWPRLRPNSIRSSLSWDVERFLMHPYIGLHLSRCSRQPFFYIVSLTLFHFRRCIGILCSVRASGILWPRSSHLIRECTLFRRIRMDETPAHTVAPLFLSQP